MRQKGIAMVVGLVFLLVLTIIGVTSLRTTATQQRMANNMQQKTIAFQDAEARIAMLIRDVNSGRLTLSSADSCDSVEPHSEPGSINEAVHAHESCLHYLGSTDQTRRTDTAFGEQSALYHFRIRSESTTVGNARVEIHQGGGFDGGSEGQGVLRQ